MRNNTPAIADLTGTVLCQMELDYRNIDCGMCYIARSADGRFFLVDSAHMNASEDHHRLHALLRALSPEGAPIRIAGWFFSHAHQDHIAMFMSFLKEDFTDVIVERLYFRFPSLDVPEAEAWSDADKATMREFHALLASRSDIPVETVCAGQTFAVGNLFFEVLQTCDDVPQETWRNYNESSAILMLSAEGTKVLFLGDADRHACGALVARVGDDLRADIVQVAHHGYNAVDVGVYDCAAAPVALYPTRQDRFLQNRETDSNRAVFRHAREVYVAGNGLVVLPLPYAPGRARVFPKEINV